MGGHDTLKFDTDAIAGISSQTNNHQQSWDDIWNGVRANLSSTAANALSQEPGGSLDTRTAEYHRKSQQYTEGLTSQAAAIKEIGNIATETNGNMVRVIRGS